MNIFLLHVSDPSFFFILSLVFLAVFLAGMAFGRLVDKYELGPDAKGWTRVGSRKRE